MKVNVKSTVEGGKPITANPERIIKMLKNQGYKRYLALEYEEDTPYEDIPVWIDKLRACIG
jgi:hypothetical protein